MLSRHPVDHTLLHPVLDTLRQQLHQAGIRPELRTGGRLRLCQQESFARADTDGLRLLAPLAKDPGPRCVPFPGGPGAWTVRQPPAPRRLRHPRGKEDDKLRARTVEPVFGPQNLQGLTVMSRAA